MAGNENWVDIGAADELARTPLRSAKADTTDIALSFREGTWGALSNACNHVGGPLGDGRLDQDYIVCPWHGWKFHRCTGLGEPGFEADQVPAFPVRVERGRVLVNVEAPTRRRKSPHPPHPLEREIVRQPGPLRLAGISTTVMDLGNPRFSGSEHLLRLALKAAEQRRADSSNSPQ